MATSQRKWSPQAASAMYAALKRIEEWRLPRSGRRWEDGTEMSYGAAFGSNGERDFMRDIARAALLKANPARGEQTV